MVDGIQMLCDITTVIIISCGSFYGDSTKFIDSKSIQRSMDSVSIKQQKGMDPASINLEQQIFNFLLKSTYYTLCLNLSQADDTLLYLQR